jgi:signal transduction histidine kinase
VRIEEMMVQTEKMMSVGGLAAGMAHEINNPLGGILLGLQNIRRRLSPELDSNRKVATGLGLDLDKVFDYLDQRQILHFLDGMSDACLRASEIVKNMLQFSRRAAGKKEPVNLIALLDSTLELAAMDYDLKKKYDFRLIEIIREYATELPLVPCIASEIQQVLLNLLRNAAQVLATLQDGAITPRVTVRLMQENNSVRIEIEDNGPGMEEVTRRRVFEPFFTTRPPGEGTGLGLSVSYYIVHDEHGGQMSVESSPDQGTIFIIQLPLGK